MHEKATCTACRYVLLAPAVCACTCVCICVRSKAVPPCAVLTKSAFLSCPHLSDEAWYGKEAALQEQCCCLCQRHPGPLCVGRIQLILEAPDLTCQPLSLTLGHLPAGREQHAGIQKWVGAPWGRHRHVLEAIFAGWPTDAEVRSQLRSGLHELGGWLVQMAAAPCLSPGLRDLYISMPPPHSSRHHNTAAMVRSLVVDRGSGPQHPGQLVSHANAHEQGTPPAWHQQQHRAHMHAHSSSGRMPMRRLLA